MKSNQYICYAQSSDWDNLRIVLSKHRIWTLRGQSPDCSGDRPRNTSSLVFAHALLTLCTCMLIQRFAWLVYARWIMVHREAFEKWTKEAFLSGKKVGSKVLTRSQGELVKSFLSGAAPAKDDHFKFWVKSRGFRVTDYPTLGLHNILCIPAKRKVWTIQGTK